MIHTILYLPNSYGDLGYIGTNKSVETSGGYSCRGRVIRTDARLFRYKIIGNCENIRYEIVIFSILPIAVGCGSVLSDPNNRIFPMSIRLFGDSYVAVDRYGAYASHFTIPSSFNRLRREYRMPLSDRALGEFSDGVCDRVICPGLFLQNCDEIKARIPNVIDVPVSEMHNSLHNDETLVLDVIPTIEEMIFSMYIDAVIPCDVSGGPQSMWLRDLIGTRWSALPIEVWKIISSVNFAQLARFIDFSRVNMTEEAFAFLTPVGYTRPVALSPNIIHNKQDGLISDGLLYSYLVNTSYSDFTYTASSDDEDGGILNIPERNTIQNIVIAREQGLRQYVPQCTTLYHRLMNSILVNFVPRFRQRRSTVNNTGRFTMRRTLLDEVIISDATTGEILWYVDLNWMLLATCDNWIDL